MMGVFNGCNKGCACRTRMYLCLSLMLACHTALCWDHRVNEVDLTSRDAIEIVSSGTGSFPVRLTAGPEGSHFLFVEMQKA